MPSTPLPGLPGYTLTQPTDEQPQILNPDRQTIAHLSPSRAAGGGWYGIVALPTREDVRLRVDDPIEAAVGAAHHHAHVTGAALPEPAAEPYTNKSEAAWCVSELRHGETSPHTVLVGAASRAWLFESGRKLAAAGISDALDAADATARRLNTARPADRPQVLADVRIALDTVVERVRSLYDQVCTRPRSEAHEWLAGPCVDLIRAVQATQRRLDATVEFLNRRAAERQRSA